MRRFAHILKNNIMSEFPTNLLFFDTETFETPLENNEIELKLKVGVAVLVNYSKTIAGYIFTKRKAFVFVNDEVFWDYVDNNIRVKTKLYVVAHNVAFDFRVTKGFVNLKRLGYETGKIIYNGTTNIYNFHKEGRTIVVLDNMNYFKSSLAILGKGIGIEKMEMPTDDFDKLIEYCTNDVMIMVKAWEVFFTFLRDNDLGTFSRTIASQAFAAYRHRFMKEKIYIHTNEAAIKLERESYRGGRTECFRIGKMPKQKYFLLDVNSMYPSVMLEYDYPTKFIRAYHNIDKDVFIPMLKNYCITARVIIKTDEPIFAVKNKTKLIFPIGIFEVVLTTRELEYALQHNLIVKYLDVLIYEKANLFKEYVEFFYGKKVEYKQAGNEAFTYLCKLFLNSLYGKFGQRNEQYEKIGTTDDEDGSLTVFDMQTKENVTTRIIGGVIEKSIGMKEGFDTMVAIAAHVTADARMRLWTYFNIAQLENIYYCDTDSMIVNMKGMINCKPFVSSELGRLDLKEHSDKLILRGAKDYTFGDNEVIKGIRKDADRISDNVFEQTRFEGIAGAVKNNRTDKMIISTIRKELKRDYNKGKVDKEGKVIPFKLDYQDKLL